MMGGVSVSVNSISSSYNLISNVMQRLHTESGILFEQVARRGLRVRGSVRPVVASSRASAAKLVDGLAGESPASADYPVGTVVISGDGAGDQTVGSPDVNVLVGRTEVWSAPTGGQAKQQGAPAQTGEVK